MTEQQLPQLPEPRASFEAWAKDHLGQGYSLELDDHTYVDPVTRWAFKAWRAAVAAERERVAALPSGRDGWQWVPKEPTKAMTDAAWDNTGVACDHDEFAAIYSAMLSAAPAMGAPEEGEPKPFAHCDCPDCDARSPAAPSQGTLTDEEIALLAKVRKAIAYDNNGDPAKDVIDEYEMIDAMRLLLKLVDGEPQP